MARPRPQIVRLSPAAAARVREIMAGAGHRFLRVGVKNGGCAGMEYTMEYAEAPGAYDERVMDQGVEILIDAKAVLFLIGTTLDYESTTLSSRFTFRNPNQTDACGCGESVTIIAAKEDA